MGVRADPLVTADDYNHSPSYISGLIGCSKSSSNAAAGEANTGGVPSGVH
jgi:hypothetical protein